MDVTAGGGFQTIWPSEVDGGETEFAVLMLRDGSQMLLSVANRRVAAAPLLRFTGATSRGERALRYIAWGATRLGVALPMLRRRIFVSGNSDPLSLHRALARAYGVDRVAISVSTGPARPNRKPVIRVMRMDGSTIGFAKVGWNDLTRSIVGVEAEFLASVRQLQHPLLELPPPVSNFEWEGLVVAAYGPALSAARRPTVSASALRAVAALNPNGTFSDYMKAMRATALGLAESDPRGVEFLAEWESEWSGLDLPVGRWHGDLTPWNTGWSRHGKLILWDWERTEPGVPIGFDAIHYAVQPAVARRSGSAGPLSTLVDSSRPLLVGMGTGPELVVPLVRLYLIDNFLRHATQALLPGSKFLTDRLVQYLSQHSGQ